MVLYSIIMFLTATLTGGLGIAIYRGKTDLIHDYHQTKVTDPAAYGKAFGKAILIIALALLLSGIVGLFPGCEEIAIAVLYVGLVIGIVCIVRVQKKFNNGIF